jgi:hypothetical protein
MVRFVLVLCASALLAACGGTTTASGGGVLDDSGAGGSTGTGGTACVTATVTFGIDRAAGTSDAWCLGAPQGCSAEWLTVKDSSGSGLARANNCGTPCATCTPMGCPAYCAMPSELKVGGATTTWEGQIFVAGTCGASMSCQSPSCAAPGRYTAVMCAFPNPSPDGGLGLSCATGAAAAQTCVEVPFDYPGTATVSGTLPAR